MENNSNKGQQLQAVKATWQQLQMVKATCPSSDSLHQN
jgi:hypothetical protein